jgi:ribosomal subunit interface protein
LSVVKHRHVAEVQVNANHLNITAMEETSDLYSAIDMGVPELERQAKKHGGKVKSHEGVDGSVTRAPRSVVART